MSDRVFPLDIVVTPRGHMALVQETNSLGTQASIEFLDSTVLQEEHNAWWTADRLRVVNSLPRLLALCAANSFGRGREDADAIFTLDRSRA